MFYLHILSYNNEVACNNYENNYKHCCEIKKNVHGNTNIHSISNYYSIKTVSHIIIYSMT